MNIVENTAYLVYVTICIRKFETDVTAYGILMAKFFISFYHRYIIIKHHRKVDIEEVKIEEANAKQEMDV